MSITALLQEVQRRRAQDPETYLCDLFPQQRRFVEDAARHKAALCSRRAGKTHAAIAKLVKTAQEHAGVTVVYLALTRQSAKRLAWRPLIGFNERYGLGLDFHHSDLEARLPNGSVIIIAGADDVRRIERLRGDKYKLVIIDEAASFRPSILATLIREIIRPALMDLQGQLVLMGTPGAACVGPFYDATTGNEDGWSVHRWTVLDNPHIPHAADEMAAEQKRNKWADDHPILMREWKGQWVRDLGSLVYPYDVQRNHVDRLPSLPPSGWHYILGIDFGVTDATACVVVAWHEQDPTVYVVESEQRTGVIPSEAAAWVKQLQSRYDFDRIVGDVGGLGKAFAEEMRRRHAIPVHAAQKSDKRGAQELMAGDMKSGLVRVVGRANAELCEEWSILQWNADRTAEDERFANHLSDAALYAWREAKGWAAEVPPPKRETLTEDEKMARLLEEEREAEERTTMPEREDDFGFASSLDELTGFGWD